MFGGMQADLMPGSVHEKHLFVNRRNTNTLRSTYAQADVAEEGTVTTSQPVAAASTANIASLSGSMALDGVTLATGDRVLVWKQSTTAQNGIYVYNAAGAWSRAIDTISPGSTWEILDGTLYGDKQAVCTNGTAPVVGTDAISFAVRPYGQGTANRVAKWNSVAALADSLIADDGTRIQINSSATTGMLNVERSSGSAAVGYFRNTSGSGAGTGVYIQVDSTASNAYGAYIYAPNGAAGIYVGGTTGNGIDINVTTGIGLSAIPTGDGIAISAYRNVSGAATHLVSLHDDHAASTAHTLNVQNDGLGRAVYVSRNNTSATSNLVELQQAATSGNQTTLRVVNSSTSTGHFGISVNTSGGIAAFFESITKESCYVYRNSSAASAPSCTVWQDHTGDSNDVLYVRGDGTGNIIRADDGAGGSVFEVKDGGRVAILKARTLSSTTQNASFTASVDTCVYLINTATAVANVTITLPDDASMPAGWTFYVKDIGNNAATRNIIIARGAGDTYTINNVAGSYTMAANKRGGTFYWDGSNIHVLQVTTT